jgi:hypothetical protein
MKKMTRRRVLGTLCTALLPAAMQGAEHLPQNATFKNAEKFQALAAKAVAGQWHTLAMGERMIRIAMELRGTPYVGYTLEIDDHVESASANFDGMDCWSFFEITLGLARMMEQPKDRYTPSDLLKEIEWTRYRAGVCKGNYLDRIHYLSEWYYDNEARGTIQHLTHELGGDTRVVGRKIQEMTVLWKSYRYLRCNPELRPGMLEHEQRIARYPFHYIAKGQVRQIEPKLQGGDIIGIVTNQHGGFCSHVGLANRSKDGVLRFMHASSNYKRVVIDEELSVYLAKYRYDAGIIVGRPLPSSAMITDTAQYEANLKRITHA